MAYGTPASLAGVEAYYTHIRRGVPPAPDQLAELVGRYEAIGGSSPLRAISQAQAQGLADELRRRLGRRTPVELGFKHADPFIEDGVRELIAAGVRSAVGLVLAPHYSRLSVGEYRRRAVRAAGTGLELDLVEQWHLAPGYIDLLAERVLDRLGTFSARRRGRIEVVFTAHSLPARILDSGDPYPLQVRETAAAVAARAGLARWSVAWQSAGRTADEWIGPDITRVIRDRAQAGVAGVIACPAGFTSDHLEILYDLDVECRTLARRLGLPFERTASLNDDPAFMAVLAEIVIDRDRERAAVSTASAASS
jgi:protoporphyrin/coproporphyrin ferrochelatase